MVLVDQLEWPEVGLLVQNKESYAEDSSKCRLADSACNQEDDAKVESVEIENGVEIEIDLTSFITRSVRYGLFKRK